MRHRYTGDQKATWGGPRYGVDDLFWPIIRAYQGSMSLYACFLEDHADVLCRTPEMLWLTNNRRIGQVFHETFWYSHGGPGPVNLAWSIFSTANSVFAENELKARRHMAWLLTDAARQVDNAGHEVLRILRDEYPDLVDEFTEKVWGPISNISAATGFLCSACEATDRFEWDQRMRQSE